MSPNPKTDQFQTQQLIVDMSPVENSTEYVWTLSDDLAKFAKKHLNEEPMIRETCLAKMRAWISRHPRLSRSCRTDNIFLLRFLRARKFDLEKAKSNLEAYIKMRATNPEWFTEIDPKIPNVEELCKTGFAVVLPSRDSENRRVLLNYIDKLDVSKHINSDVMKVNLATLETLMEDEENQIRGISYIFYCKDISLSHCSIWTPADAHKLFGSCEKSIGIRHSDINLVRLPFCLWAVVEFVKQLLSSKIRSRISVLSTDDKTVKKFGSEILPPEIGGSGAGLEEMAADWFAVLEENRSRLLAMDEFIFNYIEEIEEEEDSSNVDQPVQSSRGLWSLIPGF